MSRIALAFCLIAIPAFADDATDKLAKELRDYATAELAKVPGKDGKYSTALPDYLRDQIKQSNQRDRESWNKVTNKAEWEKFRDERIKALRESLGTWPEVPKFVRMKTTKTIEGDGYRIDNLLYESRADVWVAGNLYYPAKPRAASPVIMIAHAHHAPKHQSELQDMGVLWSKLGCIVLVIDQLGHGERRQHGFNTAKDYPKEYRVSRQDYFFRYNLNLQLSLVGDSLMGWMAWDLMRGLDVALAQPGADKNRVILMGAVAGGGDPAAVTAALDPRFTCVVPFNFGGPQPENRYPLPEDAETSFNYAGSGSWESTRNLRDSAAKGFLPWVIVSSVAPRKVIHAHEFSWDRERDPVWKRYQKIFGFYDAIDNLSFTTGGGVIHNNDPNGTHCTNIGAVHRKGIYAALKKWYDIPPPEKEPNERRTADELRCWTPEAIAELKPKPLHEVLGAIAEKQGKLARDELSGVEVSDRAKLAAQLQRTSLGVGELSIPPRRYVFGLEKLPVSCGASWIFNPISDLFPRAFFLQPPSDRRTNKEPLVVCTCHEGALRFVHERSMTITTLLRSGIAVLLVEHRGAGMARPGDGRGRTSGAAAYASTSLMIGQQPLSIHWDALRTCMSLLDGEGLVDLSRVLIWGESLAKINSQSDTVAVPGELTQPTLAEPLGSTIASTNALGRPEVKAILARGGLVAYRSVLDSPFVHVPHDALPINVFRAGDLPDAWSALAPKPLRLEGLVDGTNRRVTGTQLEKALKPVSEAYKKGGLVVKEEYSSDAEIAKWIVEQLKK